MIQLHREPFEFLSAESIQEIHCAALDILENVGIKVFSNKAIEIFGDNGLRVDTKEGVVKFPPGVVETWIQRAPSQFTWHGRNPEKSITMGGDRIIFSPTSTVLYVYDMDTGNRRRATFNDAQNFVKIIDALDFIDESYCVVYPGDVPDSVAHVYIVLANALHSGKPIRGRLNGSTIARDCIKMAEILAGGKRKLEGKPNLLSLADPVSPLLMDKSQGDGLIEYSRRGLPVAIVSLPFAGATGPMTLAGELTLVNAENLSHIVLAQMVRPGTPVLYGTSAKPLDMRTGTPRYGAIERGMLNSGAAQLARFYNLPSRGSGGCTESKLHDMQAGYETALNLFLTVLSGTNYISTAAGGLESNLSVSYEKLVIDHEIIGSICRAIEGIEVTPETIALDVIKEVKWGGNYLTESHTLRYLREAIFHTEIADTQAYEIWKEQGEKDTRERAMEKVRTIMSDHKPEPLNEDVERCLRDYVAEVERRERSDQMV
jgi:trimethylamine--corrinoid protein Co-methyltransferase